MRKYLPTNNYFRRHWKQKEKLPQNSPLTQFGIEKSRQKMKSSIAVPALCATLAATTCHAWAPATGIPSRQTAFQNNQFQKFQRRRLTTSTTSIYATVEDEQKKGSDKDTPNDDAPAFISDAFNKDDAEEALTFFSPIPYSKLTIGIVKETFKGENRVSQTPDSVKGLVAAGFTVIVESGGTYGSHSWHQIESFQSFF